MKINPINIYNYNIKNQNNKKQINNFNSSENISLPGYKFYQSFLGGYSVNLSQTYQNLDACEYPNLDIKKAIEKELDKPQTNKTLYDIHFEKYKGVLDCYDLNDLIEKYPEFRCVQPAYHTEAAKGGFIDNFKSGQYEIFNNGEDLTLQLIKLYWGQGFSLNDLSNYVADNSSEHKPINLYYTMKKLNIPLMTKKYGAVLKLSNKEYNEKFTSQMSIKSKEAKEARQQLAEGEPVVIPRGELSQAHKEHISLGLKKHFQEHPEKLLEMSKRQKLFYEQNPEYKEELSEVLTCAWKTQEGRSVASGLSKYLRKNYNITIKQENIGQQISTINANIMTDFWDTNKWARRSFSEAMRKAWKYIKTSPKKEENSVTIETYLYPQIIRNKISLWAKTKGYKLDPDKIGKLIIYKTEAPSKTQEDMFIEQMVKECFTENPDYANYAVTALGLSLVSFINDLYENKENLPASVKNDEKKARYLKAAFEGLNDEYSICKRKTIDGKIIRTLTMGVKSKPIYNCYVGFIDIAHEQGCDDVVKLLEQRIDRKYH